jgi:anti-anti-sigma regulatory factor
MIARPPVCDRAAAAALFPEIAESLGTVPLVIDAGRVEKIGQAMLQLLVSAARTEGGITVHRPSAAFRAALGLTGLSYLIMEGSLAA